MKVFETTALSSRENFYLNSELDNSNQLASRRVAMEQTNVMQNPTVYNSSSMNVPHQPSDSSPYDAQNNFQTNISTPYTMTQNYPNQEMYYNTFLASLNNQGNVKNGFKVTKNYKPKINATSSPTNSVKRCPQSNFLANLYQWDINDPNLPKITNFDAFNLWPQGNACYAYSKSSSDTARRHGSGWAMRNTNNHNTQILKKSCLGVLLCTTPGCDLSMRPAICDKARHRQEGRACPKPNCNGKVHIHRCRGHEGYPVTHFWRENGDTVYFQAKGTHDHIRPDIKPVRDTAARRRKQQEMVQQKVQNNRINNAIKEDVPKSDNNEVIISSSIGAKRRASKAFSSNDDSSKISQLHLMQPLGPDLNDVLRTTKTRKISPELHDFSHRLPNMNQETNYNQQINEYQSAMETMNYFQAQNSVNTPSSMTPSCYTNYLNNPSNQNSDYGYMNQPEYSNSSMSINGMTTNTSSLIQSTNGSSVQNASWSTPSPPNNASSLLFDTFQNVSSKNNLNIDQVTPVTSMLPMSNQCKNDYHSNFVPSPGCNNSMSGSRENLLRTPPSHEYLHENEEERLLRQNSNNINLLHHLSSFNKSSSLSFNDQFSEEIMSPARKMIPQNVNPMSHEESNTHMLLSSSTPVSNMHMLHQYKSTWSNSYTQAIPFQFDSSNGSTDSSRSNHSENTGATYHMAL